MKHQQRLPSRASVIVMDQSEGTVGVTAVPCSHWHVGIDRLRCDAAAQSAGGQRCTEHGAARQLRMLRLHLAILKGYRRSSCNKVIYKEMVAGSNAYRHAWHRISPSPRRALSAQPASQHSVKPHEAHPAYKFGTGPSSRRKTCRFSLTTMPAVLVIKRL